MKLTEEFGEWIVPGVISVAIHALILALAFGTRGCGETTAKEGASAQENGVVETAAAETHPETAVAPDPPVKPPARKPQAERTETKGRAQTTPPGTRPGPRADAEDSTWAYHVVQRGEHLTKIANHIAGSDDKERQKQVYRKILDLNPGLKPNQIQVGQKIKVPKQAE